VKASRVAVNSLTQRADILQESLDKLGKPQADNADALLASYAALLRNAAEH
jgi:hypothetical protein